MPDTKITKLKKNIKCAKDCETVNNNHFKQNITFFYECSLSPEDRDMLSSYNKPQLTFNILESIVNQYVKQITDSIPSIKIKALQEDDPRMLQYAEQLNDKIEKTLKKNKYATKLGEAALQTLVGGKAIFKLTTDYVTNTDFKQKIVIDLVNDPTMVYFDPSSKKVDRSDSFFVVEELHFTKAQLQKHFPDAKIDDDMLKMAYTDDLNMTYDNDELRIYIIFNYYEKSKSSKTIYQLASGRIVEEKPKKFLRKRVVVSNSITCKTILGNKVINEYPVNSECLPFIQVTAKKYTKNGKLFIRSFIDGAIDAQRAKNLLANIFHDEMLNQHKAMFALPIEQYIEVTRQILADPNTKNILLYKGMMDIPGRVEPLILPKPQIIEPATVNPQYMEGFQIMDQTIQTILGSYQTTLNQRDMSGKALYNLAQYINGMLTPFTNNLLISLESLTLCMLSMFKKLMDSEIVQKGSEEEEYQFDYEYDLREFEVYVEPGVNYKLQQEATLERMIHLSEVSPNFAQWLNQAGIPLLLENMDLNGKAKVMESYEQFTQQQAQQAKSQPPSPEMIMAQAKMTDAQASMLKEQNVQKEMELKEAELEAKVSSTNNQTMVDMHKLKLDKQNNAQDNMVQAEKIRAENLKTVLTHKGQQK